MKLTDHRERHKNRATLRSKLQPKETTPRAFTYPHFSAKPKPASPICLRPPRAPPHTAVLLFTPIFTPPPPVHTTSSPQCTQPPRVTPHPLLHTSSSYETSCYRICSSYSHRHLLAFKQEADEQARGVNEGGVIQTSASGGTCSRRHGVHHSPFAHRLRSGNLHIGNDVTRIKG